MINSHGTTVYFNDRVQRHLNNRKAAAKGTESKQLKAGVECNNNKMVPTIIPLKALFKMSQEWAFI